MVVLHLDSPIAGHPRTTGARGGEPRWSCALVNNMPDGAFVQTERQFLELLDLGSANLSVDVRLYTMPGVPRSEATARRVAELYTPFDQLYDHPPQLLIVTGANPVEAVLQNEPFWADLAHLLTWARGAVPTMVLSCLSAHAALAVFDGVERRRLPSKCTGLFTQQTDPEDPLSTALGPTIVLPHSRLNVVPTAAVRAAGYDVPLYSDDASWSVATRRLDGSTVILLQSHPEYGPISLLREYQRDLGRYVRHERDDHPVLPLHCTAPQDAAALEDLHRRIVGGQRRPELVDAFPFGELEARAPWPWRPVAVGLYAHWLAAVPERVR